MICSIDDVDSDDGDDGVDEVVVLVVVVTPATELIVLVTAFECSAVHLVSRKLGAMSSSSLLPTNELIFALEPISRICLRFA